MIKSNLNLFNKSTLAKSMAIVLSLGVVGTSHGQAEDASVESLALEEIIVTARNRAESLQDVPLAITAFDADALKKKSISELEDVARFTPGFTFEDFSGGLGTPVIRGQSQVSVTALEQNVSAFFDGVYIPRAWAIDVGTANVNRIEIVKGPQSARYGRNAFSGAINYVPVKATLGGELSGDVEVTIGSDEREDIGASILAPIGENFAVAASFNTSDFDGTWDNAHPFANLDTGSSKGTNGNIGGWDKTSYAVSIAAQPVEGWDIELGLYSFETENEARASRWFEQFATPGVFNCGNRAFGQSLLICGELPEPLDNADVDPRSFGVHSDTDIIRFNTSYQISEAWSLDYTFGNIEGDVDIGTSSESDPTNCGSLLGPAAGFAVLCNFQTAPIGGIDYDSHELRFNYETDSLRFAFGGFTSEGEDDFRFFSFNIAPVTNANSFVPLVGQSENSPNFSFNPGPFNVTLRDEFTTTDVTSVFGEVQWTSNDGRTRLGAELRYSETDVTLEDGRRNATFSEEFSAFTPRFSYERDVNEDSLLFASIARGAKTGGFNAGAVAVANQSFDEEFNWTYELGMKNTLLDGRLVLNGSLFYTDWTDLQVNSSDPDAVDINSSNIVLNLGNAEIFGIEVDTVFQATENITLDATFSFADGTYDSGSVDQRLATNFFVGVPPCDDVVCNSNGDISGNEIERAPRTQFSFGAQWDDEFANGNYFLRGDLSWQSEFFASPANIAELPSRTLVNLRAGVEWENGFSVSAWVRNATDEVYVANAFVVLTRFNNQFGQFFGERRTLGVTAGYSF